MGIAFENPLFNVSYQTLSQSESLSAAFTEKKTQALDHIIEAKQALIDEALGKTQTTFCERTFVKLKRRYNVPLIAGDLFTAGYLTFQGVQSLSPALAASSAGVNFVCGIVGGAINIGVALYCLYEGLKKWHEGDKDRAIRLFIDFTALFGLGTVMICTSLALKTAAFSGIGAFFAANPWVMMVFFLMLTLFGLGTVMICTSLALKTAAFSEIGAFFAANPWVMMVFFLMLTLPLSKELIEDKQKYKKLVADLKIEELKDLIAKQNLKQIKTFAEELFAEIDDEAQLSKKMEELQQKVEVEAAMEIFKLWKELLVSDNIEKISEQFEKTEKVLKARNRALNVRIIQQVIYGIGGIVTVGALCCRGLTANLLNGMVSFSSAAANLIALGMDTFWPFNRNTPMAIDPVTGISEKRFSESVA